MTDVPGTTLYNLGWTDMSDHIPAPLAHRPNTRAIQQAETDLIIQEGSDPKKSIMCDNAVEIRQ